MRALPQLQAEERLTAIEAAAFPYMEKSAAKETVDKNRRLLRASDPPPAQRLAGALASVPMKVKHVPKETPRG